jgi:ribosomal-protein-alanine N-acetyltransferase
MIIATEHLRLREFVPGDLPAMLAYVRDPLYLRYYTEEWERRSDDDVATFLQVLIDNQRADPRRMFQFAMTPRDDDRLIGNCGIRRVPDNEWEANIGYELAPAYWRRGFASEAARALVDFGFRELGLHRITAGCIADNVGSVRVLEGAGLRLEGRLRDHHYFRGRWWDELLYAVLEPEWAAARGGAAQQSPAGGR